MRYGIIYKATNAINGKSYIGQTIRSLKRRIYYHYYISESKKYHFCLALKKYKRSDWTWDILYDNVLLDDMDIAEISAIYLHDTYYCGYNSTVGGKATVGYKHTEQCKKKISRALVGRKISAEHREKISRALIGTTRSEEFKKRLSESRSGSKHPLYGKSPSVETIKKMSNSHFGKKHSKSTCSKISLSNSGRKFSQKHKDKIANANSRMWEITLPSGEVNHITNLHKYCIQNNLSTAAMSKVAHGKQTNHKEYKCKKL